MNTNTKKANHNKQRFARLAKLTVAFAICYFIYSATSTYSTEIRSLANINLFALASILTLTIIYRVANANGWSIVLKALGQNISSGNALRIWITSEACRWLPGSVWSYGSRAVQARNHGASTLAAGSSLVLELLLTIAAWTITAGIGVYAFRSEFADFLQTLPLQTIGYVTVAVVVTTVAVAFGSRRICRSITSKIKQLGARFQLLLTLKTDWRMAAAAGLYYFAMCLFNGIVCSLVVNAMTPNANVPVLAVIGINATAWLIGFFAFLAPGGLVVREGALAAMLAVWMPADQALAIAIAWRILQIGAEIACMLATWTLASCKHAAHSRVLSTN